MILDISKKQQMEASYFATVQLYFLQALDYQCDYLEQINKWHYISFQLTKIAIYSYI